jgi:hypothetical protein
MPTCHASILCSVRYAHERADHSEYIGVTQDDLFHTSGMHVSETNICP